MNENYNFSIVGSYRGRKEVLDTAPTNDDALYLAQEYRLAFGPSWVISIIKTPKQWVDNTQFGTR